MKTILFKKRKKTAPTTPVLNKGSNMLSQPIDHGQHGPLFGTSVTSSAERTVKVLTDI
uniref:Uncharacterized protein n=1 Tax=Arundo donax TaxID=35708 RepID=A0A0A9AKG5_ARUDO